MKLKKLLALILALAMVLTSMPLALAEDVAVEAPAEQPAPVEVPAEEPAAEPVPEPVAEPAPEPVEEFEEAAPVEAANEVIPEEAEIVAPVEPAYEVVVPKYSITFNSNGGSPVTTIADISEGTEVHKPADPTKFGYNFTGWTGDPADFVFIEDATAQKPATEIDANYTLTAGWKAKEVNVSWSLGTPSGSYAATPKWEGNAPAATKYDFAADIPALQGVAAVCEGYRFVGWKYVGNDNEASATIGSEGPIVVTAQWEILTVNVTFAAGQGAPEGTVLPENMLGIDYGTVVAVPDDLESKDGKTFTGWTVNGAAYVAGPVKEDIELVGSWSQDEVTVTFWKDKGDETPYATKTTAWGGNVELPGDPVDEGRTFSTWLLADGTAFVATGIKADVDVYASWNTQTRKVSFVLDGGEGAEGQFADQNVLYNTTATDPGEPTRFGYHFTGWKVGEDDFTFDTPITVDTVLTAQWEGNTYNLVIDTTGIAEDVYYGKKEGEPVALVNPVATIAKYDENTAKDFGIVLVIDAFGHVFDQDNGYTYLGLKQDSTTEYEAKKFTLANMPLDPTMKFEPVEGKENEFNLVLTPIHIRDYWAVEYVGEDAPIIPEGETRVYGPAGSPEIDEDMKIYNGKEYDGVIRYGVYYEGWYNEGTKWNFDDDVTGHMKLEAKILDVWTVTFDCNGGEAIEEVKIPDGMSFNEFVEDGLPIPELDKNTFVKWLYKGQDYDGTAKITTNITLVAQWVPTYYDVVIDPDNGDDPVTGRVLDSKSINDTKDIIVPVPKDDDNEGCIFVGWFLEDDKGEIDIDGPEYDFDTPVTEAITVRAGWIEAEVAKVEEEGRTLYATLAEAVTATNAVESRDTLMLLKNIENEEVPAITEQLNIDLNSKTLSVDLSVGNNSILYLMGGTVSGSKLSGALIHIVSGTYLNISFAEGAKLFIDVENGIAKFDDATKDFIEQNNEALGEPYNADAYMFKQTATSSGYWTLVPYFTLTINCNNGDVPTYYFVKVGQDDPTDYEYNFGTEEEPSDIPSWDSHDFVKWTVGDKDFTWGTAVTEDTIITANWQLFHTVTFDFDDGDEDPETGILEVKVNDGDKVSAPEKVPSREGKVFEFWGIEPSYEEEDWKWEEFDFSTPIDNNLTLKAKWEWVVTFDARNDDDPIEVNVKNGAQVDASQVPNPTRDDGSTFIGWYWADEYGNPDRPFDFRAQIWGDAYIVAAWNNIAWQIEFNYDELTAPAVNTNTELTYSGTEEQPILISYADKWNARGLIQNPDKLMTGFYLGYRFEAPNGITEDNANLYSIYYDGDWHKLTDCKDAMTSMSGHLCVSMFEEVSIDSVKQWVDAGEPAVFTYKFARTADIEDESKVETLTVTFDPNYVEFWGYTDEGHEDWDLLFNVTDYRYIYTVKFDHNDGETGIIDGETQEIESSKTIDATKVPVPEYEGKGFNLWTANEPDSEMWPNIDYSRVYTWDWASHTFGIDVEQLAQIEEEESWFAFDPATKIFEDVTLYGYWSDTANVKLIVDGTEIFPAEGQEVTMVLPIGADYYIVEGYAQSAMAVTDEGQPQRLKCQVDGDDREFLYWIDQDGNALRNGKIYNGDWSLEEDLVLTAVFGEGVVVTFDYLVDDEEGEPMTTEVILDSGDQLTEELLPTDLPELVDRDFQYWTAEKPNEEGRYEKAPAEFKVPVAITLDTNLYAYWTTSEYTITFVDEDGETVLEEVDVPYGKTPEYTGEEPTKEGTAQYSYTFAGWTPELAPVEGEATYTATYAETVNEYTITFVDEDGETVLATVDVAYGETPEYPEDKELPSKEATAQYTYTFAGWTPELAPVEGEATYTATYTETVNEYTITFVDEDGETVLATVDVAYGETPEYPEDKDLPSKEATAQYTYTFAGWTPELAPVEGEATYAATYTETVNEYTITFVDEDGETELASSKVKYGIMPEYTGKEPTKEATAEYTYTFAGWTPEVVEVTGDATYTATYESTKNSYTITWQNDDGSVIDTTTVEYGVKPTHADPTKAATAEYTYTFAGWTPEVVAVTGDATYKASYTETINEYTITFMDEDGKTVLASATVKYGIMPEYTGKEPTKAATQQYSYKFDKWIPTLTEVTGDKTYYASYAQTVNEYTIKFVDDDGETVLQSTKVKYGDMPEYTGEEPTKEATQQYSYEFDKWTPALAEVTEDATYTATYTETVNEYAVTFDYGEGESEIVVVPYGSVIPEEEIPEAGEGAYWTAAAPETWEEEEPAAFEFATTAIEDDLTLYAYVAPVVDPVVIKPSLNLQSEIGINFFFYLAEGEDPADYNVNVAFSNIYQTIDDDYAISDLDYQEAKGRYRLVALEAGSDEMADEVTLTITKGDEIVAVESYSIYSIASAWLVDGEHDAYAELLKAMLQYGNYAQIEFDHNADKPIKPEGAPALVAIPDDYATGDDPTTLADYIAEFKCGLALDSSVGMNVKIKPAEGYGIDDFTITVTDAAGKEIAVRTEMSGGYIVTRVTGIYPDQLINDYNINVTVNGTSATYVRSVMNCAYDIEQKGRFVELVEALYQYSVAANDIFGGNG